MAPSDTDASPWRESAPLDWTAFRSALVDAEFTAEAVSSLAGLARSTTPWDGVVALRRTAEKPGLQSLIRLFLLGQTVDRTAAAAALTPGLAASLETAAVLKPRPGDGVTAAFALQPLESLYVAHDFAPPLSDRPLGRHHVVGVSASTLALANFTPRCKVSSALDMGTGSGFQAMLAARHAGRVLGTDVSERALGFARFGLRLNGLENVDLAAGSYFEPVEGRTFDLIASNPPYVMSPETSFTYRDSADSGTPLSASTIERTARHLSEGGLGIVLLNWPHGAEEDWLAPLRAWLQGTACDAIAFRLTTSSPLDYAANWLAEHHRRDPAEAEANLDRWVAWLGEQGVERITWAAVLLRKRLEGPHWLLGHDADPDWGGGVKSPQLLRMVRNMDFLEGPGRGDGLFQAPLVLAPEHALDYVLEAERGPDGLGGGWKLLSATLRQTHGLCFSARTDRNLGAILAACDGRRPARAAVEDFARTSGLAEDDLLPGCAEAFRALLEAGFLQIGAE